MSVFIGFQGFRLVFRVSRSVFYGFSRFQAGFTRFQMGFIVIHGSRPVFMVPGWFLWFFQDSGLVFYGFGWFILVIQGSSLVVHVSCRIFIF